MSRPSDLDPIAKFWRDTMDDPLMKALASRIYVRAEGVKAGAQHAKPKRSSVQTPYIAPNGDEWIDSEELARRINAPSKRWVDDHTRSGPDPIPSEPRGRKRVYKWNLSDPKNLLTQWLRRQAQVPAPSHQK